FSPRQSFGAAGVSVANGCAANPDQNDKSAVLLQSVNNRGEVAEGLFAGQLLQRIVAPETEQHHARLQPRNRFNAVQSSPGSIAVLAEIFNLRPEPATKQRRIIMPWFSPVT